MLRGMKFPVSVSVSGGSNVVKGIKVIDQNVILAIKPASSLHPWNQNLAPDEDIVFDIKDNYTGNLYTMHIREFFQEMERQGYARLLPGRRGLRVDSSSNNGEMIVNIQYENLESGEIEGMQVPISGDR